jgi:hypothetical protein
MTAPGSRRSLLATALWLCVILAGSPTAQPSPAIGQAAPARAASLPEKLGDAEFWKLVTDVSEPGGYFRITDNFTSNEREVAQLFSMLRATNVRGGVYLGVGPEQNFTYIAAIRPAMAFIVDIRRQAVMQHLMFKAMFEMAKDRADFISLLFARPRPAGLSASTPIQRIWESFFAVPSDLELSNKTYARVVDHLTKTKRFTLTPDEISQLQLVFYSFYSYGPSISTRGSAGRGGGGGVTFADLTGWATDAQGQTQSFLSTEEHFRTIKALHERNLIVPVSGDFGGPQAIRAIGAWLKEHHATVSAFYVSNVEQYLFQDGKASAFYANVGALPVTDTSVFIRPYSIRRGGGPAQSLCAIEPFLVSAAAGRIYTNNDALACIK